MTNHRRKGFLLFQFLALLGIASLLIIALLKIHAHNTLEYRLLEDGYRMDLMLEMASQTVRQKLTFNKDEMTYPDVIQFSNGTVRVEWNEKAHQFILKAHLPNGHSKEDTLYIQFVK